ncbi:MAG: SDR family oxidoreductase [Sandaracinaceae bacterium]|nr:SDR family oxidoreductase [Sandaracinaceae bacterium]MDW8246076.1 SDR family oxidoreductase [Sandaracinaceae bacterium]
MEVEMRVLRTLVTGASRGIGRAIALGLSRLGEVIAVVRREEQGRELAAEGKGCIQWIQADLADRKSREGLLRRAEELFGPIDSLVHAAGVAKHLGLNATDSAFLLEHMEVNFFSGFELARDLGRVLVERRQAGSMVFLSSTLVVRPASGTLAYAVSKGALEVMVRALAVELAPHGIRVNALRLGAFDTEMLRRNREGDDEEERLQRLAAMHLLGRLGEAEEAAQLAIHLLNAGFATGAIWTLDGGLLLGPPGGL